MNPNITKKKITDTRQPFRSFVPNNKWNAVPYSNAAPTWLIQSTNPATQHSAAPHRSIYTEHFDLPEPTPATATRNLTGPVSQLHFEAFSIFHYRRDKDRDTCQHYKQRAVYQAAQATLYNG